GVPAAPCGRVIRRRRIVRRSGWVIAVVAIRVIIRVIVVGVREHGAKREGSEPNPDGGTRADPAPTPTSACIRGPRHRRQPDGGEDSRGDGQAPTSLPKEPAN